MSSAVAQFYRMYAARCAEIAMQGVDSNSKATFEKMAQSWLVLADEADKPENPPSLRERSQPVTN